MKIYTYNLLAITILSMVVLSCKSTVDKKILHGAWRMDSLYDYYNGFSYMNRGPQPAEVHVYEGDHTMLRRGMGHVREYYYKVEGKNLVMSDTLGAPEAKHMVLRLDSTQLVLKKENTPLFPGENQVKYQIRFFTRISMDALK
jgi:hypothetical protein